METAHPRTIELFLDPAVLAQIVVLAGILANVIITIYGKRAASKEAQENKQALIGEIKTNTLVTTEAKDQASAAYQEANNVNLKIAALGAVRDPESRTRTTDKRGGAGNQRGAS